MRAYPLRLKDELADAAKAHADALGISFNALVSVALDAYLHGEPGPAKPAKRAPSKTSPRPAPVKPAPAGKAKPASKAKPVKGQGRFDLWHRDPRNWRNFHDPAMWPWVDPDWTPPEGLFNPYDPSNGLDPGDVTPQQEKAFEDAYWSAHERPSRPWFEEGEITH